jgi:putative DNA primase/helicase
MGWVKMDQSIIRLAERGYRLMPVLARNKVPILDNWSTAASSDLQKITEWANKYPNCNWGLLTGDGLFVVDIDPSKDGDDEWKKLVASHGEPLTVTTITGSKGLHFYFKMPVDFTVTNTSNKLARGIDTRGTGGQVIIPPSTHANGNKYEWVPGRSPFDIDIAPAPQWLLLLLKAIVATDLPLVGEPIEKGERNNAIYHNALQLARNNTDMTFTFKTMRAWCDQNGAADISDSEIQATIESAYKKAKAESITANTPFEKTDDDNARRFLADHGKDILSVSGMGWYIWDGKRWGYDDDNAGVTMRTITTMRALRDEALEEAKIQGQFKQALSKAAWANMSLNAGRLAACLDLSSKYPEVRRRADEMDAYDKKFMLNVLNGTVDLRTGELYEHKKEDLLSKMVGVNYNPEATCPTWNETLELAFNGDRTLIDFMHRALGYTITGSTTEQCLFICWGEAGNNGKSTILEALQRLLGDYAQMSDIKVITSAEMDNRVASSMAKLQGARLVSMNEADEHQKMSEAIVKQLTGGDTVEACKKYHEPFNYLPAFKLWIRTNDKPVIRGNNDAIWRRIKLIPFEHPIPVEKRKRRDIIDEALANEAEGILAWLVAGAMVWYKSGLMAPTVVDEAVNAYRSEMDMIQMFFDDCLTKGEFVSRQDVYAAFTAWCKENGYKYVMSADSFGRRLSKKLPAESQGREKRNGKYIWLGITLSESAKFFIY